MINQQYWIDTDPFLDIQRLKAIEPDIIRGICLSRHITSSVYDLSIAANKRHDFIRSDLKTRVMTATPAVQQLYAEINTSDRTMTALFCKLCFGTYTGGTSVMLRHPRSYMVKNYVSGCFDTKNTEHFPSLMDFIHDLPFSQVGRALIFVNDHDLVTHPHRDTDVFPHRGEFIWFRPNLVKKFFISNEDQTFKSYVTSYSAFFNEQDMHGTDASPRMCFSLRVDGMFTEQFREQLGIDKLKYYR